MKRISLITLTVAAIIAGSVSCSKINDIDERLSKVENPLSMVTLNIVPDYDDGTVREPNTTEDNGEKSTSFYLDIAVTPAEYGEILSDAEKFIHKAVFSPVQTKRGISNAFTVTPQRVTYATEAMVPFLQAYFSLDEATAALLQDKNTPYTVSYSIEDKDGVHGAATSFVAISHEKGSGPDVPTDDIQITLVQPDKPLPGVFTVADPDGIPDSGDETKVQFSQGNLASHIEYGEWGIFPNQYDCMNTVGSNNDIVSLYSYGSLDPRGPLDGGNTTSGSFDEKNDFGMNLFPGQGWRMLSAQEWCYLMGLEFDMEWADITDETNPRRNLFRTGVEVMGCNCIVLYPDNYQGTKNETFITESDYLKATEAGIVFLPLAGYTNGNKPRDAEVDVFGEAGYYWSHTNADWDSVYSIYFLSPTSGDSIFVKPNMVRRSYYSIRLVKDYGHSNFVVDK